MHGEEHTTECYFYFFLDYFELGPQSTRNSNDDIASCSQQMPSLQLQDNRLEIIFLPKTAHVHQIGSNVNTFINKSGRVK